MTSRSFIVEPAPIDSWLKASLRDEVTRDWLRNTGLPEHPALGPAHLGHGAWIALKGQEDSPLALEAQKEADAWKPGRSSYLGQSEDLVSNRREWAKLFLRFTVHARWAGPRGNKQLAQYPKDVARGPLDVIRILNTELVFDADLYWEEPIPMNTILSHGINSAVGGVYLWAARTESRWIPLYAGIAGDFSQRFKIYVRDYGSSIQSTPSNSRFYEQINRNYSTAKPAKLRNAFLWATHHDVSPENLFVLVAQLPRSWYIARPFPACYFRDGSSPKGQMQMVWAIDNILSSAITGQRNPLNTESSKERRVVLHMDGHWPDEWPKIISSLPLPLVMEKRRREAENASLVG